MDDMPTIDEHINRAEHAKFMTLGPCEKLVYEEEVQEYLDAGWEVME